jgi:ferric-dicitrate binding protein FerR (iron transport regulator)
MLKTSDGSAFNEIYERYWEKLLGMAFNRLKHLHEAEDVVHEDISKAIEKFINGSASEEDQRMVDAWYYSFNDTEVFISTDIKDAREKVKGRMKMRLQKMLTEENERDLQRRAIGRRRTRWYAAAAAVVFLLAGAGIFKYYSLSDHSQQVAVIKPVPVINDVAAPSSSNATLTLADGSRITLDSAVNGSVALQGKTWIIKLSDGELAYDGPDNEKEIMYNTLSVPKGSRVVTLKLSDGTQVWLNSESSLRYPVAYTKGEQKVYITGEAYFEVSKDPNRTFLVTAGGTTTKVLGTSFNVNAYPDNDANKVTLLEGRLKVTNGDADRIIAPGQQAYLPENGAVKVNNDVDLEEVMAWKNGLFKFNKEDLKSIMHKIERWYNVEISYEGDIKTLTFGGVIPRKENVSSVLDLLQMTGVVKFTIKPSETGRAGKIIVKN